MLKKKQRDCINLMITTDMTQREIAEKINISETTIGRWKKTQKFRDGHREQERDFLKGLSSKAIRTMKELLDAKSEHVRYLTSKDILDRAGHKPDENINIKTPTIVFDIEETDE